MISAGLAARPDKPRSVVSLKPGAQGGMTILGDGKSMAGTHYDIHLVVESQ